MISMQEIFILLMTLICILGLWVGKRMSQIGVIWWVDWIIRFPAAAAMFVLSEAYLQRYTAFASDLWLGIGYLFMYSIIASRFTKSPWLDIHKKTKSA